MDARTQRRHVLGPTRCFAGQVRTLAAGFPATWPGPLEAEFLRQFSATRVLSTKCFTLLHLCVTLSYVSTVTSPLAQAVGLTGALLSLLLFFGVSEARRPVLRLPVVLLVKLTSTFVSAHAFTTDFQAAPYSPLLLIFKVLLTARAITHFSTGLGLQLPLAVDLPLQLLCVASATATAVPRQCFRGNWLLPGQLAGVASERATNATLFELNEPAFNVLADILDWPFAVFEINPKAFAFGGPALCAAIYTWTQLVLAYGVPATVLFVAERRERHRFLLAKQLWGGGREGRQEEAAMLQRLGDAAESGSSGAWVYFAFLAQISWCIIRTACHLAL